jgi:hypothetical protein
MRPFLLLRSKLNLRAFSAAAALVLPGFASAASPTFVPTDAEFQQDASWLRTHTAGLVVANRATHQDGRTVFYTDALKHHGLLFTRDFAYFVEFAGDLLSPKETSGYLEFLLAGQRNDGGILDRLNRDGEAIYSPAASELQWPTTRWTTRLAGNTTSGEPPSWSTAFWRPRSRI